MVPNKQLLPNVLFHSTKYGKREMCVDIIKTITDVFVQHVEKKSVFTFQPVK